MEHEVTTNTILRNVVVQAINLIIFFLLFKYLLGGKIISALHNRALLVKKLQHADQEYQTIVSNAHASAHEILQEAQSHKKTIVDEATQIAQKKAEELLEEANNKATSILSAAQVQTFHLESDLKNHFESMVKNTAGQFVQKIFDHDPDLQKAYIQKVESISMK